MAWKWTRPSTLRGGYVRHLPGHPQSIGPWRSPAPWKSPTLSGLARGPPASTFAGAALLARRHRLYILACANSITSHHASSPTPQSKGRAPVGEASPGRRQGAPLAGSIAPAGFSPIPGADPHGPGSQPRRRRVTSFEPTREIPANLLTQVGVRRDRNYCRVSVHFWPTRTGDLPILESP